MLNEYLLVGTMEIFYYFLVLIFLRDNMNCINYQVKLIASSFIGLNFLRLYVVEVLQITREG